MRTPGLVDRHSASRVLLVISLIFLFVLGLRIRRLGNLDVDLAKNQLPEPWTYRLQDMGPFERYLLELPQPFFQVLLDQQKTPHPRLSQSEFYGLADLDPQWKFRSLNYIRFSKPNRYDPKNKAVSNKVPLLSLNSATAEDLQKISGIGPVLSNRIISYRNYLGGFSQLSQCYEVYGLDSLVVQRLLKGFRIERIPQISKVDLDTVSLWELMRVPYVDRKLAQSIVLWRTRWGVFPIDSLAGLVGGDSIRIQRLALYLK